jgi:hypothetical protein
MDAIIPSRIYRIIVRFLGIPIGFMMAGFALAALIPIVPEGEPRTRDLYFGAFFAALALCLLIPYSLIKSPRLALWFFSIFLVLVIVDVFGFRWSPPSFFTFFIDAIIFANVYVNYSHYQKLLQPRT